MWIGRRAELEALEGVVDGARAGRSGVLLVRGVPGVGKTALLDACARDAAGFRVLRAEGVEAEAELAFDVRSIASSHSPFASMPDRLAGVLESL
jgi:MoxR-like ATPase